MNNKEEQMQTAVENGLPGTHDDADMVAYRKVFDALSALPEDSLSPGFADKVVGLAMEQNRRGETRIFVWLGLGVFLLLVALIVAVAMSGPKIHLGFLKGISAYAGLFAFGALLVVIINWLDRRLVVPTTGPFPRV